MGAAVGGGLLLSFRLPLPPLPRVAADSLAPNAFISNGHGGHLYMQTNESRNAVIHYRRSPSGAIREVKRILTDGAGSGVLRPIYDANGPNAFEGAGSVILTPDRRCLFTTNGGDNSVSSFGVGENGQFTLLDVKPTGNP